MQCIVFMIGYSRYFSNLISFIVVGIIIEKASITHFKLIKGDVLMCMCNHTVSVLIKIQNRCIQKRQKSCVWKSGVLLM